MSNHLEDLVAEWLEFNGYFVRKSILVGARPKGGFEGELDVVAFNPSTEHLLHVECSLDADKWSVRKERFEKKFDRGRRHMSSVFHGLALTGELDQVALFQFGGGEWTSVGGGRIVWVRDFVVEMIDRLAKLPPDKRAVPSTLPLVRTMQLAAQGWRPRPGRDVLIRTPASP